MSATAAHTVELASQAFGVGEVGQEGVAEQQRGIVRVAPRRSQCLRRPRAGRGGTSGRAAVAPARGPASHATSRRARARRPATRRSSGVSVRSSSGSMRATVPPRWARTGPPGVRRRARTSSVTSGAPRATIRPANVVLPAPERAQEGDGAACERHRAGVQHVHAAQHRGQRQHLSEDEALPAPRRSGRRRGDDAPAVGRDEVAAVTRRPHAEADLVVALDGEPDAAVDEPAFQQRARARRSPAPVDGGARTRAPATCRLAERGSTPARRTLSEARPHESPAEGASSPNAGDVTTPSRAAAPTLRPYRHDGPRMPLTDDDRLRVAPPGSCSTDVGPRPPSRCSRSTGLSQALARTPEPTLDDLELEMHPGDVVPGHRAQRRRQDHAAADHRRPRGARPRRACASTGFGWATSAAPTSARSAC